MITNNFNKELRGISDALRDLGYSALLWSKLYESVRILSSGARTAVLVRSHIYQSFSWSLIVNSMVFI